MCVLIQKFQVPTFKSYAEIQKTRERKRLIIDLTGDVRRAIRILQNGAGLRYSIYALAMAHHLKHLRCHYAPSPRSGVQSRSHCLFTPPSRFSFRQSDL